MAVTLRLTRRGRRKKPFYRIIAADKEMRRDGRFIEMLGTYNTLTDPPSIELKEDRVKYWLDEGARPSDTVGKIIEKTIPGYWSGLEEKRLEKIRSRRAARKARVQSGKQEKSAAKLRRKGKAKAKAQEAASAA